MGRRSRLAPSLTNVLPSPPYLPTARRLGTCRVAAHPSPFFAGADPSWSPDGTKIAFQCGGERFDLCVMNADGSRVWRLTDGFPYDSKPAWSPDESRIAFHRDTRAEADSHYIFVVNSDGTNPVQVTTGGFDHWPSWSPDGRQIAYMANWWGASGTPAIHVVNGDGTGDARLRTGRWPDWSPRP